MCPHESGRIFLIGGSAGSIEAMRELLIALPGDFGSPIVVVIHISPESSGTLAASLARDSKLVVVAAGDDVSPRKSFVYVAPANHHLIIEAKRLRLVDGPTENRHRPAIDPLFRSAARAFGPKCVGILLSGYLDDGCAGLFAIKRAGGTVVVQDPADAMVPDMPENAIERVDPDYVVPVAELAPLMVELAEKPIEISESQRQPMPEEGSKRKNGPSVFTCPTCHGTLWEREEGGMLRFKCRVGHAFSADTVLEDQALDVERALWAALRVLEEHAEMATRLSSRAGRGQMKHAEKRYSERAKEATRNARVLKKLLVQGTQEPRPARSLEEAEREAESDGSQAA